MIYIHVRKAGLADIMPGSKTTEDQDTARFVLTLSDQPGQVLVGWGPSDCKKLLAKVIASPVLLRAARFAVLGARAFHEAVTAGAPR